MTKKEKMTDIFWQEIGKPIWKKSKIIAVVLFIPLWIYFLLTMSTGKKFGYILIIVFLFYSWILINWNVALFIAGPVTTNCGYYGCHYGTEPCVLEHILWLSILIVVQVFIFELLNKQLNKHKKNNLYLQKVRGVR